MVSATEEMLGFMERSPVIPVLVVERIEDAVPLAEALVSGGLTVLEVTLRTPVALECLSAMRRAVPQAVVGAGTVNSPAQMSAVAAAGAAFAVSPGATPELLAAAAQHRLPYLPGAVTASEVLTAMQGGLRALKFFPAEAAGGVSLLKSWASPLSEVKFCPTGGITAANAREYLALDNVTCVGGSWVAPRAAVVNQDWATVESLARRAAGLGRP